MKSIILISSIIALFFQTPKKVYIINEKKVSSLEYCPKDNGVNLFIDKSLVSDEALQRGIKMYIASFFVDINKEALTKDFIALYKKTLPVFAKQHKKEISRVIYYLEHADHGNLVRIYGREAYELLEIKELQPAINTYKKKLYDQDMYVIDVGENATPIVIDSPSRKK